MSANLQRAPAPYSVIPKAHQMPPGLPLPTASQTSPPNPAGGAAATEGAEDAVADSEASEITQYDAIVKFQSLSAFIEDGSIQVISAVKSTFDFAAERNCRVVAIVGLFDKGKTFLINKLFGLNLQSGKLHNTEGLSFYWVKDRRMLVLDSAGVQGTVSYRPDTVDPILDAQKTESLMFELISRMAHHLIFVVNDYTWFEQQYTSMLHQKYVRNRDPKELIIVHNLRTTSCVKEAQTLFERQVVTCYKGQKSHVTELAYVAALDPPVHHVGICEEASPAGRKYNDQNLKTIMNMLEMRQMLGSDMALSEKMRTELERLLPMFLVVEAAQHAELFVKFTPGGSSAEAGDARQVLCHYSTAGRFVLSHSSSDGQVMLKAKGVVSPLGEIVAHDVTFLPMTNVFDKRGENGSTRVLRIECPGVDWDDMDFEDVPNGLKVIMNKKKAIEEMEVEYVDPIRQQHGKWEKEFAWEDWQGMFQVYPENQWTLEQGVLTIPFEKVQRRRYKRGQPSASSQVVASSSGQRSDTPTMSSFSSLIVNN